MLKTGKRIPKLFTDHSEDSKRAKELLDQYGIEYLELVNGVDIDVEDDATLPSIHSGDGPFSGRDGILSYIELVTDADKPIIW